jgi:CRP/FNR family transcriptional regulator
MEMPKNVSAKLEAFFANYRTRKYAKGKILILNGDTTDYIYHMVNGKVKQYDVTYRGDEIIINVFKPPAFFPMSLAVNKVANSYIYEADTDIEVQQAPADEVVDFIKANPDVMFDLLSRVYRGVDGLLGRMSHLMASSAKARLMYELIVECRRFGDGQLEDYKLSINEVELAARAGLSRETISREMQALVKDDLVEILNHAIIVKDVKALEKKLGFEL